ncbi:MAG: flagellar basal body-associated protein FliL [Bacillota bacterium]|nr:flagellar basal body-associated protein FliL [Bacillota bacterium]
MKGKGKSRLILLVGLLVFIAGAGALVWFLVLSPGRTSANPAPAPVGKPFDAGSYLTNLADEGGRRVLRAAVELSVGDNKTLQELKERSTEVRNEILALLRSKRLADLEGATGMVNAAAELTGRINALLGRPGVLKTFFTDFIIQ